jgi:hypothetical protein
MFRSEPGHGTDLNISFTTFLAHNYVLQTRTDLAAGDWTTLPGTYIGNGGIVQTTLTNALNQPQGFYRLQQAAQ